eukprot:UC1_evm1s1710
MTDHLLVSPPIVCVGGRRYRKNTGDYVGWSDVAGDTTHHYNEQGEQEEEEEGGGVRVKGGGGGGGGGGEQGGEGVVNIVLPEGVRELEDGTFAVDVSVPAAFKGKLMGQGDVKRRAMEEDTSATIHCGADKTSDTVTVTAADLRALEACRLRVEMAVDKLYERAPPTHFLSLPLLEPGLQKALERFRTLALDLTTRDDGLSVELFVPPEQLHITIGVLKLYSRQDVAEASALLSDAAKAAMKEVEEVMVVEEGGVEQQRRHHPTPPPLAITVKGLEIMMNDDPSQVHVLYAGVSMMMSSGLGTDADASAAAAAAGTTTTATAGGDGSGDGRLRSSSPPPPPPPLDLLQSFCEAIEGAYVDAGLMENPKWPLKLHATLVNSKRRHGGGGGSKRGVGGGRGSRRAFDARGMLKSYGATVFGKAPLNALHLSSLNRPGEMEHYCCEASVGLIDQP